MANKSFAFVVDVFNMNSEGQALRVMQERFDHEEEYGFDYTLSFKVTPAVVDSGYQFTVDVDNVESESQAVQVMQERVCYEEEYGFDYRLNYLTKSSDQ